jgi:YidC/Oxa1 family membrane protein insertase
MDRKSLVVVGLCVLLMIFWQPLMRLAGLGRYIDSPRQPAASAPEAPTPAPAPEPAVGDTGAAVRIAAPSGPTALSAAPFGAGAAVLERSYHIETPLYRATFSNRGARLTAVELKRYAGAIDPDGRLSPPHPSGKDVEPEHRVMLTSMPVVGLDLGAGAQRRSLAAVAYDVAESTDAAGEVRALAFTARDSAGTLVRQTWRVRPDSYALDLAVEVQGVPAAWRLDEYSLTMRSWPLVTEHDLAADERGLRASSMLGKNIHREGTGGLLKGPKRFDGSVRWAGVQSRYFVALASVEGGTSRGVVSEAERRTLTENQRRMLPPGSRTTEQHVAMNSIVMGLPGPGAAADRFTVFVGPSEYFDLDGLGADMERVVDLGWTWLLPLSKLLLQLMNWLFALLHNYGVAIVLLATLARVALHPLNMASMKSMRAMQKLQPEIERMREKYKNDPQAMNTAMMALYKENKVNPAGGCLPMIIQMPMFLALYQVLFNAIELRQAPFVAWMTDLSAPDVLFHVAGFPIRMLPLLMAASGFWSQKLTPTDPRQAPTMYLMNLFMLVFFYNLPSGLVLYWTVMNVLTAAQQWMVLRADGGASAAVVVEERGGKRRGKGR